MILTRVAKSISNSCLREIWFIGSYHPKGMSKEGNLFARFFSGLALPSLRYQASSVRGKGPDSTGILRDTPGIAPCINASDLL